MMRFLLFAKRSASRPPSEHDGSDGARKSHPRRDTKFAAEAAEIETAFAAAVIRLPVKNAAALSASTIPTVKAWRILKHSPRLVPVMFLARRVDSIRNAVMEIIGGNSIHKNRLLNVLFTRLSEIAVGPDEISAAKARAALKEFAEVAKRFAEDGDAL